MWWVHGLNDDLYLFCCTLIVLFLLRHLPLYIYVHYSQKVKKLSLELILCLMANVVAHPKKCRLPAVQPLDRHLSQIDELGQTTYINAGIDSTW